MLIRPVLFKLYRFQIPSIFFDNPVLCRKPIRVVTLCKAWVCGCSLAGVVGLNLARVWKSVSCECCVLSGRGICFGPITGMEESPTECGGSEYDLETSTERGLRPARVVETRWNFRVRGKYDRKLENGHGHYQFWILQLHVSFFNLFCCRSQFKQKRISEIGKEESVSEAVFTPTLHEQAGNERHN